jgi:hypothetical protein
LYLLDVNPGAHAHFGVAPEVFAVILNVAAVGLNPHDLDWILRVVLVRADVHDFAYVH